MSQVMAQKLVKIVSFNRETAIKELTRGYELVKQLQSKLESSDHRVDDSRHDDAMNLSDGVLQTLTVALSLVKPSSISPADGKNEQGVKRSTAVDQHHRFQKRGRKEMNSWTMVTPAPYLDDYQWRKYGQKNIQNAKHPRTYYRCTHSCDQGCPATKQVQQQNHHGESPMYLVICNNQHTCITTTKLPTPKFILDSPRHHDKSGFWIFEPKRSNPRFTNVIKEEQCPPHSTIIPEEMSGGEILHPQNDISARSTNPTISSSLTMPCSIGIAEEVFTTTPDMDGCLLSPYHILNSNGFEFDDEELDSLINSFIECNNFLAL